MLALTKVSPASGLCSGGAEREAADRLAQVGKAHPRRPRRLGNQAVRRHPGKRVGLEAEDVTAGVGAEVDAAVAAELEGAGSREGGFLSARRETGVDRAREDLLGHPRSVLALVVEQLVLGADLAHGQG